MQLHLTNRTCGQGQMGSQDPDVSPRELSISKLVTILNSLKLLCCVDALVCVVTTASGRIAASKLAGDKQVQGLCPGDAAQDRVQIFC